MSNEEKAYLTQLSETHAKQRKQITALTITNTVLLMVIIGIVLFKTCAC